MASRRAQRVLLNAGLVIASSLLLLLPALVVTTVFYRNYLPDQKISLPLYLQYSHDANPSAIAPLLSANLKTHQPYDITVKLTVPRSPANEKLGNFMVAIYFLDTDPTSVNHVDYSGNHLPLSSKFQAKNIKFASSRPALIPYKQPLVSTVSRLVFLIYYMFIRDSEVMTLEVAMAERLTLGLRRSDLPLAAYVEIRSGEALATHAAEIVMTAQLYGLRWIMHHYRLISFIVAVFLFWAAEIMFMGAAWLAWISKTGRPGDIAKRATLQAYSQTYKGEGKDDASAYPDSTREPIDWGGQVPAMGSPRADGSSNPDLEADDEMDEKDQRDLGHGIAVPSAHAGSSYQTLRRRPSHKQLE